MNKLAFDSTTPRTTMPLYVHYKTNQDFYLLKTNSNECRYIYIIIFVRKGRQQKLSFV